MYLRRLAEAPNSPPDLAQYAVPRGGGDHSAAKITSIKDILADFKHTF